MSWYRQSKNIELRLQSRQPVQERTFLSRFWHGLLLLPYGAGLAVFSFGAGLFWLVSALCHAAGLMVLWPPRAIAGFVFRAWQKLLQDADETFVSAPNRLRQIQTKEFAFGLLVFLFLSATTFGVVKVGLLLADGLSLKGMVLGQATSALQNLNDGKEKLSSEDVEAAQKDFALAVQNFSASRQQLEQTNIFFQALTAIVPQGADAKHVLDAGKAGSEAAVRLAGVFRELKSFSFDASGLHAQDPASSFVNIKTGLQEARGFIATAKTNAAKVSPENIPQDKREKFVQMQDMLVLLQSGLDSVAEVVNVFATISSGNKHVLLLLQNNNELRPTGGFLGTYGAFDLQDGQITKQTVSSIYDLDGQLSTIYEPPLPLYSVTDRWHLRDSNWFASFPESAETVISFYELEAHRTPDVVIAITPAVAVGLLRLTGPIAMPQYNTVLDADNFVEATQVETSVEYDKQKNKPKQMLADFLPVLLSRIKELPKNSLPDLAGVFEKAFSAKDILLYSRDGSLEQTLEKLGWDGALHTTSRDFLSIVTANLSGTKTDLSIEQSAELATSVAFDGSITNTLKITRKNPLPQVLGLRNKSFVRVYVPLGSKLLSSKGFTNVDLNYNKPSDSEAHSATTSWERGVTKEVASGMYVGTEAGKTFFGNWMDVQGLTEQTVEISYKLPFKLDVLDRYSLLVQKQPGAQTYPLRFELAFPHRHVLWASNPTTVNNPISKEITVDRDHFYGVVLQTD